MATTTAHVILLEANAGDGFRPVKDDRVAAGTLTPGDVAYVDSNGKIAGIASATFLGVPVIVVENPYADTVSALNIDQTYAANETVFYVYPVSGDLYNLRLAASNTITIGDIIGPTTTAGQVGEVADAYRIGVAEAAVSTGGAEIKRLKVRIR
jgi:hypothetical protein